MVAAGWGLGAPGPLRLRELERVPRLPRGRSHVTAMSRDARTAPFQAGGWRAWKSLAFERRD